MGCQQSSVAKTYSSPFREPELENCIKIDDDKFIANPDRYYWKNLPSNVMDRADRLCHDRQFCSSQMLADDETLVGVCQQDEMTLEKMAITRFQIADVLETIQRLAEVEYMKLDRDFSQEEFNVLDDRYTVMLRYFGGVQTSPFEPRFDRYNGGSCNVYVKRNADDEVFKFGELLIKLIRYHGFFEGNVTGGGYPGFKTFRVDPQQVTQFFDIQPKIDYSLKYGDVATWEGGSSSPRNPRDRNEQYYEKLTEVLALECIELPNGAGKAYLSWFTALFSNCGGTIKRVNLKKLASLPTVSDQMDYLIKHRVAKLATTMGYPKLTKANVLKAVEDFQKLQHVTVPSLLKLEVLGTLEEAPANQFVMKDVFGGELQTWGLRRHEILPIKHDRRLVEWNKEIGKN